MLQTNIHGYVAVGRGGELMDYNENVFMRNT